MCVEAGDIFPHHGLGLQLRPQRVGGRDQSLQLQSDFTRFGALAELIPGPVRDDGQMVSNKHGV